MKSRIPQLSARAAIVLTVGLWWAPTTDVWAQTDCATTSTAESLETLGDAAWTDRAIGAQGAAALPDPVGAAIEHYESAVVAEAGNGCLRVKLLRALFFRGEFATEGKDAKHEVFETARDRFEETLAGFVAISSLPQGAELVLEDTDAVVETLAALPFAGEALYWGAAIWGRWGEGSGMMAALREGVANKIRDLGLASMRLAPGAEEAAPYRLLGRMHHEAPKVPMITGWIDRSQSIVLLEEAVERAPDNLLNRAFLADALLVHGPKDRHNEARSILAQLQASGPRAHQAVEDAFALDVVTEILERP